MLGKKNPLFVSLFIILFSSLVLALDIPPKPAGYVNDYASMMSYEAGAKLEKTLSDFETATTNQIVVATFKSLEGESLEDFSIRLAGTWKIGTKEKDNGVILLIFKEDRQIRIEVGYGLEAVLTDALCSSIIRNEIAPYFKKGSFDEGVLAGINAIIKATKGEYALVSSAEENQTVPFAIFLLFFLVFTIIILSNIWQNRPGNKDWTISSGGSHGGWGWGGGGFGGGGFGGGGGSFGGGGASGRW